MPPFHYGVRHDGAPNVISSTVTLKGDIRIRSDETSQLLETRMKHTVEGVCRAHQIAGNLGYSVNSPAETDYTAMSAAEIAGENNVDAQAEAITASEDFSWILKEKPGAYILIGSGRWPQSPSLHNPHYDFSDSILPIGTDYRTRLVKTRLMASK